LLEKWNAAAIELRIDIDVIAACRSDLDACESDAAKRLIAIADEATRREGRARIGVINRAVNLAISAASDMAQYGVEDKWASPLMTFASGRGDCEDYALAKYAALRAAGFANDDLRLVIVHLPQSQIDHAVLSVRYEGRWLILDNRRFAMLDAAHLDAVPLFALREDNAQAQAAAQLPDAPYLL
jgi:predicted transglutaminase-like cysteine proteinase